MTRRQAAKLRELIGPNIDYLAQVRGLHRRDGQIVARRKTNYATDARLSFGDQCTVFVLFRRRVRPQRGKVVVEYEGVCIAGIAPAAGSLIARTQIASWIIFRK